MDLRTGENEVLTIKAAARMLHCSPAHVYNVLNNHVPGLPKLAHIVMGRRKLIRRKVLEAWLEAIEQRCC